MISGILISFEVASAGYDAASQYTVLTVNQDAGGSKLTIEGPIATLYNPTETTANFTFTLERWTGQRPHAGCWDFDPIARMAESHGILRFTESYDSDSPHDPAPFRRRYSFGGRPALLSYATRNNLPAVVSSCELWCEQGDGAAVGPYMCREPQGSAIIYIPTYCAAFNITIDPVLINDDPRFMIEIHTVPDPYCNCAADETGAPDRWSYNDIWLDVVVIVDASEAMNDAAIKSAVGLVDSLISDGVSVFLITDTTKKFSTRIGVITMTDLAEVIYNMNMTKADKIEGKIAIKKGVKKINLIDAFNAATNMFYFSTYRAETRQIIFYITESTTNQNLEPLSYFKETGVIVANSLVQHSSLLNLASTGYYFVNSDNKQALGAFCKANCFCTSSQQAYGGKDPANTAAGGCYSSYPMGSTFSAAQTTCSKEGGIIAVDHSEAKEPFSIKATLREAYSKSDFFWIGFSKSDGAWRWEDKSTDPYTNWEVDEPNSAAVARCAYVDSSTKALAWGAGNCNVAFPFVCEDVPCSVGNKDC